MMIKIRSQELLQTWNTKFGILQRWNFKIQFNDYLTHTRGKRA